MSTRRKPPVSDPAQDANRRILADREARIDQHKSEQALASDLGLDVREPVSQADNAVEFLADEWDRKTFGEQIPTYTRVVYGPDSLLTTCPEMKARIEQYGLEAYANSTAEAIRLKEENAVPDPVMRKGLRAAIARFGVASVADAFRDRILKIPQRTVEVEADRADDMIMARPLEEAVMKYGTAGMAPKFLSQRCIDVLGLRGYRIVRDERGDPVRVGTLIMGEIPQRMAEARRRHYANESEEQVRSMQENFEDTANRAIHNAGKSGIGVLGAGEVVHAHAAGDLESAEETAGYLGRSRETGFTIERQA